MPDVSILLTQMRKEAENIEDITVFLFRMALKKLFVSVEYLNQEGFDKHKLKDNLEAKELTEAAFNDYFHDISDHTAVRSFIDDFLIERYGHHEKGGLLRMLKLIVKLRELRDYCSAFASKPSEFTRKELENLRTIINFIKMCIQPSPYSANFWTEFQPITMGTVSKEVDIKPLIAYFEALSTAQYEEGATEIRR